MFERLAAKQPGAPLSKLILYECFAAFFRVTSGLFFRARSYDSGLVPPAGPLLLAANHQSYLDPPLIGIRVRQRHLTFVAKSDLFKFGPFARVISWLNAIPMNDTAGDLGAIKETVARLSKGAAVLIFPEGSRCEDGAIAPFKRGVALLVKRAKCPVVPVAIEGAFDAWPISRKFPRLFGPRVYVKFGAPIAYEELMRDGPDAALELLYSRIESMRRELRAQLDKK
jgi:1-acyl-sn-glycerol-3-phosphate acyltransferase